MTRLWDTILMGLCIRIHIGCTTTKCTIPGFTLVEISLTPDGTTGQVEEVAVAAIQAGHQATTVQNQIQTGFQIPEPVAILIIPEPVATQEDHRGPATAKTAVHHRVVQGTTMAVPEPIPGQEADLQAQALTPAQEAAAPEPIPGAAVAQLQVHPAHNRVQPVAVADIFKVFE